MGHWYNYSVPDAWARYKRMTGHNVFNPMGFDAFGLPAENYAIKTGIHPKDSTEKAIQLFTIPENITEETVSFLKQYDKYIEVVNENKDEYLIDLTSYININENIVVEEVDEPNAKMNNPMQGLKFKPKAKERMELNDSLSIIEKDEENKKIE